jgi:hypothetical protein
MNLSNGLFPPSNDTGVVPGRGGLLPDHESFLVPHCRYPCNFRRIGRGIVFSPERSFAALR